MMEIDNAYFHFVRDKRQGGDSQSQQPTIRLFIECVAFTAYILSRAITILCHIDIHQLTLLHGTDICVST